MAAIAHLRREEKLGLGIAVALHVALVAALLAGSWRSPPKIPPAERMTVSLSDSVSLNSMAPKPSDASQAAVAPVLAPESAPLPAPTSVPVPAPIEPTVDRSPPKPVPAPAAKPVPKQAAVPKPVPKQAAAPKPVPVRTPAPSKPAASKQPAKAAPSKPAEKSGGGSLLGPNFLKGITSGERENAGTPAAAFGPAEAASLKQAIARQLKPHWTAPEGVDAEKLVTFVRFRLNPDGSLNGDPVVVSQSGITPSNEAQKGRHAEQAIRAVRLAAPFNLPAQFYDQWKVVTSRFDRELSQ